MHSASEDIANCWIIYWRVLISSRNLVQAFTAQCFRLKTLEGIKKWYDLVTLNQVTLKQNHRITICWIVVSMKRRASHPESLWPVLTFWYPFNFLFVALCLGIVIVLKSVIKSVLSSISHLSWEKENLFQGQGEQKHWELSLLFLIHLFLNTLFVKKLAI